MDDKLCECNEHRGTGGFEVRSCVERNAVYCTSTRLHASRGRGTINYVSATNTEVTKLLR